MSGSPTGRARRWRGRWPWPVTRDIGGLDRRLPDRAGDRAGDPVEGERGSLGSAGGVRQGGLPSAGDRGEPDRLAEGVPAGVLAVREDGEELRRDDQDGVHRAISEIDPLIQGFPTEPSPQRTGTTTTAR